MSEQNMSLNINNVNYTVKTVFLSDPAETFEEKIKRLIVTEKLITNNKAKK